MHPADQHQPRCPDCQRNRPALIVVVAVVFIIAFASGFCTSLLLCQERVREEGQRRLQEFLLNADRLGIIDHGRLDELATDSDAP